MKPRETRSNDSNHKFVKSKCFSPTACAGGLQPRIAPACTGAGAGQVQRGSGKGSEGSGEGLGGFGAEPGQVQQGSGEGSGVGSGVGSRKPWCKEVQQGSGEGSRKGSGEGRGGFGAEPGQVQQGSGEGLGGFGVEPGQVQQGSGDKAKSGWTGFPRRFRRRFREALVQSQVRFNRVVEKVPEKVWEALVQSQVRFNRVPEKVPEKVLGIFGAKPSQIQRVPEKVPEKVLRKTRKNKTLRLLGIPPKLIYVFLIHCSGKAATPGAPRSTSAPHPLSVVFGMLPAGAKIAGPQIPIRFCQLLEAEPQTADHDSTFWAIGCNWQACRRQYCVNWLCKFTVASQRNSMDQAILSCSVSHHLLLESMTQREPCSDLELVFSRERRHDCPLKEFLILPP